MAERKLNPFVNGFRLDQKVFEVYERKAKTERRKLVDVLRIALEDHAQLITARESPAQSARRAS